MMKNSEIVRNIIRALYTTAGRRTTQSFAVAVIGAIVKTLEQKFDFLKYININAEREPDQVVNVTSKIDSVDPLKVARAIETIVQIIYMDLKDRAGLYFIKELQRNAGEDVISSLKDLGVDLELLQIQQHYLYRRQSRGQTKGEKQLSDKEALDNVSLLGYSLENVSHWNFDSDKKECIIYDKNGKVLDKLNLDNIVKNYIGSLTEDGGIKAEINQSDEIKKIDLKDKELELLKMINKQDVDTSTVLNLLHLSPKELSYMIQRLLTYELLQYISQDEVAITEIGIEFLKNKEKELTIESSK